ncbi:MAG: glycosyltransferase family 4 protein [Gammaproteobacteria bacterium]|nr:glycosyltransferase family 4 protein [Gammaproteobacteria bacterium]
MEEARKEEFLRVAYDYQIFGSQRFGGITRYFFELANNLSLVENGEIECLINAPVHINHYLRGATPNFKISGYPAPFFKGSSRLYSKINNFLSPYMLRRWGPDIVHETYYCPSSVSPPNSRIVLTVFDMIHELYPGYMAASDRTKEWKRVAVQRADHIICISENTRQDLIRLLRVPAEKTTVVHLGFTLTQHEQREVKAPAKRFLLYVGSRGGYKNFDRLLAAFALRKELRENFDLIAFGGGEFTASELQLIQRLKLRQTQVQQVGGGDAVLAALYKSAAMFVYPSIYEGFGIPPLEAMNFGCPVACSNASSIPEVVGNAAAYFDPLEVESIADALLKLSTDSVLRRELVGRGRTRVGDFSWHKCARQTLEIYRRVLL